MIRPQTTVKQKTSPVLSERDFRRIGDFIGEKVGIQLPESKRTLVEGRIRKRLRKLNFSDFKPYLDYALASREGEPERLHLIDAITTNKTNFFRESEHFRFLIDKALPTLANQIGLNRSPLNVWSAGCSSGEEAYTLAIVLSEAVEKMAEVKFRILATDISNSCLETAAKAIYTERCIESVETSLRQKYFLRSNNPVEALVQMGPELRNKIQFGNLNLMTDRFDLPHKMHIIFCRNVMIYFNKAIREALVRRFQLQLAAGGYLFVGHAESLSGLDVNLEQVFPMVYRTET